MEAVPDARIALLERLIDHAPLFPPACLDLPQALDEDRRARTSRAAFALGRFVCPASRFPELPDVGRGVTVVLDGALEPDGRVEAVESPFADGLGALASLADEVYVELPLDERLEERLGALASLGLHAKVRCGGASVPAVEELARFVRACAARELAFKATAGLHHAIAGNGGHGFLNLLAAVAFGHEEDALAERDPSAFRLDAGAFSWRDREAGADELLLLRRERLHAIGSCSFFEPVEELDALGMLPG